MYLLGDKSSYTISDPATLIDWINVENYSGFQLAFKSAGGGATANIDESDDGGVTVTAGAESIELGAAGADILSFTSTAKYLRVRVLPLAEVTVSAVLTASSSDGLICTLTDCRSRLGIPSGDTDNDAVLLQIIAAVKDMFETICNRPLILNSSAATEYYTGSGRFLQLKRYPVESITSIIESLDYGFDEDALTEDTEYRQVNGGKDGIIYRMYASWPDCPDSIQVIYTGGYVAAGGTAESGQTAMPGDLREAAIEQSTFIFKRRDDIGLSGIGFEGGSMSKFSAMKLLPIVEQILKSYRRPRL